MYKEISENDMSKLPAIFLSYNPNSEFEETLAIRLHTIGAVHGFQMLLPDRYSNIIGVNPETKSRILLSDYFILFSTSTLSTTVKAEIEIAYRHLNNKKKVLVIYDKHKGKNLVNAENCTEIYIDSKNESIQAILEKIITEIKQSESKYRNIIVSKDNTPDVLAGILLAGLGLLLLGTLLGGKNKR